MDSWSCKCGNEMSLDSYREQGTVNDSYLLIYKCNECGCKGYTSSRNTKDIAGASVIKVMDKEVYTKKQLNDEVAKLENSEVN